MYFITHPRKTCWLLVRHVTSQYHLTNLLIVHSEKIQIQQYHKQITGIIPDINKKHRAPNEGNMQSSFHIQTHENWAVLNLQ